MKNFLIELSVIHLVLVLAYFFILRKEQYYGLQRFYLILVALVSMVIPLIKLPKLFQTQEVMVVAPTLPFESTEAVVLAPVSVQSFWNDQLLFTIYLIVTGIFLLKFLFDLFKIILLKHKSHLEYTDGYTISRTNHDLASFTFFNWIFLNKNILSHQQEYGVILKHEEAHASLLHTYDLILFELYTACFWWLPSAWFVQKEIKKIHEYQADTYALKSFDVDHYSSILISSILKSHGLSLANSFHDGLILKRLKVMKQKTKKMSNWKFGALTTLFFMLFTFMACTEDKLVAQDSSSSASERETFTIVAEQPSYEGGMDALYRHLMNEIRYPDLARKNGVEGRIYVQFVIERNGTVSDVQTVKGIGAGCGQEAERVISKLTSFKPGVQRGRTVRTVMTLPIEFKLDPTKANADNNAEVSIVVGELQMKKEKLQLDVKYTDGSWKGTLKDNDGNPLPGANIVVEGTKYGRVSDLDGSFSIEAKESQNVIISFVGYERINLSK